jgi:hypothetical protein
MDFFSLVENAFDRVTYQSDLFFWVLFTAQMGVSIGMSTEAIDVGASGMVMFVLALFILSWTYTNARRRGCGMIKSALFGLLNFAFSPLGALVYLVFRPRQLVFTSLPPSRPAVLPVFDGPVWIFARAPFRFLMKLSLWSTGIAFLIIGVMEIIDKL